MSGLREFLMRLFLTALLLFGAMPLSYGSVPPSLGEAGSAVARGVGHAVTTEAVYGGKFENVLKRSLISEASAASFKFIGHELKTPDNQKLNLPETTVLHAMVGGALAQISGGDFTTGAIATATSHVVAEEIRGHYLNQVIRGDMSMSEMETRVLAITNLVGGAAAIAVHPDMSPKELAAAQAESASVVQNNSLKLIVTAAKIGRKLGKIKGKLTSTKVKKVLKEEGLDIVGDLYTFIDPEAGIADMAWAAADLTLGTNFNRRGTQLAKRLGEKLSLKHMREANRRNAGLHDRINRRGEQAAFEARAGFRHERSISGRRANAEGAYGRGGQREWNDNDVVHVGTLPGGQKPGVVSRAHANSNKPEGPYLGDARQMRGKPEGQLKREYALPKDGEYNYVTDYRGAVDRPAQVGPTGRNQWGEGGNTQVQLKVRDGELKRRQDFHRDTTSSVKKP
jgi:hypothetical protein